MADFNWKGIDLNLLIALQALYKTNSVSKAAERCYVSQSAMSHSLQRLRKLVSMTLCLSELAHACKRLTERLNSL